MVVQKVGEGQSGFWLGQKTSLSKRSCRKSSGRALHVAVVRQQSKWQKQSLTGKAATTTSVMVVPQLVQDLIFFISFGTPPTTFHVCLYIDKRNIRSPLKRRLLPIAQPMHMWQDFYSKSQPARIKIYHPNADLEIVAETSPLQLHHLHFLLWNGRFYTQREFMITFIGFPISYTYHAGRAEKPDRTDRNLQNRHSSNSAVSGFSNWTYSLSKNHLSGFSVARKTRQSRQGWNCKGGLHSPSMIINKHKNTFPNFPKLSYLN